ncbi:protein kinase domain-containing protein [Hyalangium versicolor]|uniref:protein kinase domain-containing protein n=1 Tax=Hyalangium versicolor TaxID=2861190 RepID=UPI001CCE9851|nr:protein kinase [Hyalangium versicolor]
MPEAVPSNPTASLGCLHLTDLHQGLKDQSWRWPSVRQLLYDDLEALHGKSGPWDLVFFTGDLTQRGSEEEFQALDETLTQLWAHFRRLGSSPLLLVVPGNHDLVRPPPSPALEELREWQGRPEVRERFWQEPAGSIRAIVDDAFRPFSEWVARWYQRHPVPSTMTLRPGLLPGDFSVILFRGELRLGVVGLNSAFLQLTGGDYKGLLDLGVHQFHGACAGDGVAWQRQNHLTFLLTHHPVDWLHARAQQAFRAGIGAPGRLAAHFFGHMHEAVSAAERVNGFKQQCRLQGASLFGLETFGGQEIRIHGYSAGRVDFTSPTAARLRIWPRILHTTAQDFEHIVPDQNFQLREEEFSYPLEVHAVTASTPPAAAGQAAVQAEITAGRLSQARVKYSVLERTGASEEERAGARREVMRLQSELRMGRPVRAGDVLSARYELLREVGRGGFGTVWEAYDDQQQRFVAVKVLHQNMAEESARRERFFSGVEAMARLSHPNIVKVFDKRGEDPPYFYAVMEYVPGGDLETAVKQKRLSPQQLLGIILQVGEALEEAHRAPHHLIHRDVKPANILLDKKDRALLIDFDLVRYTDVTPSTRTDRLGTLIYSAPEVLIPEPGKPLAGQADVFSLGMTVLSGLYGGNLTLDVFRNPGAFIKQLVCDERLKPVLARAVEWNQDKRYQTVAEFCEALRRASKPRASNISSRQLLQMLAVLGLLAVLAPLAIPPGLPPAPPAPKESGSHPEHTQENQPGAQDGNHTPPKGPEEVKPGGPPGENQLGAQDGNHTPPKGPEEVNPGMPPGKKKTKNPGQKAKRPGLEITYVKESFGLGEPTSVTLPDGTIVKPTPDRTIVRPDGSTVSPAFSDDDLLSWRVASLAELALSHNEHALLTCFSRQASFDWEVRISQEGEFKAEEAPGLSLKERTCLKSIASQIRPVKRLDGVSSLVFNFHLKVTP